jgi:hypothetical protein
MGSCVSHLCRDSDDGHGRPKHKQTVKFMYLVETNNEQQSS